MNLLPYNSWFVTAYNLCSKCLKTCFCAIYVAILPRQNHAYFLSRKPLKDHRQFWRCTSQYWVISSRHALSSKHLQFWFHSRRRLSTWNLSVVNFLFSYHQLAWAILQKNDLHEMQHQTCDRVDPWIETLQASHIQLQSVKGGRERILRIANEGNLVGRRMHSFEG